MSELLSESFGCKEFLGIMLKTKSLGFSPDYLIVISTMTLKVTLGHLLKWEHQFFSPEMEKAENSTFEYLLKCDHESFL